jgi:DNA-binding IclR family transcriptional regulator
MEQYLTPNLVKALEVLRLLAKNEQGLSSSALEKHLSIPRTTAFRILKTLCHTDMAQKKGNLYFAGPVLFEIGLLAISKLNLRERAVPVLQELTRQTSQTSHLAIPSGWHSLILEVCDSPHPIRVASRSGTLADLHCSATGKIFLSYLYAERIDEFCSVVHPARRTLNTMITPEELKSMVEQVRRDGYSRDDEEYHQGVRCMAAPVFDMQGELQAAIGITGPADRIHWNNADVVKAAAEQLSRSLGKH